MPFYHKLGKIPHKRHTTFKKKDGTFHYEELFGTIGFDGMSSLLYHLQRPTQVKQIKKPYSVSPIAAIEKNLKSTKDTFTVGTRIALPSIFPLRFGKTSETALAAPVDVGIIEIKEFLALLRSL